MNLMDCKKLLNHHKVRVVRHEITVKNSVKYSKIQWNNMTSVNDNKTSNTLISKDSALSSCEVIPTGSNKNSFLSSITGKFHSTKLRDK